MENNQEVKPKQSAYDKAPKDPEGWVDASKFLPPSFDMCLIQFPLKKAKGWWTGHHWDGFRIRPEDKALFWKYYHPYGTRC